MRGRSCGFRLSKLVSASEGVNTDVYQEILRKEVFPWVQRMYPDGKDIFWQIQW
jgi:hypothetical protein